VNSYILKLFCFFSLFLSQLAIAEDFPMKDLHKFADALNIEGGDICRKYLCKNQAWANICVVLDRPFYDGIEWQVLTDNNIFPLKEASILEFNEAQVNFFYVTMMNFYKQNAHAIANKPKKEIARILIQVHRNTSGLAHVALLESLLLECYPQIACEKILHSSTKYQLFSYYYPESNVEFVFCYGVLADNLGAIGKYSDCDIVLSFSLVAGFNSEWKSGSFVISESFVPFPLKNVNLELEDSYKVTNHLNTILESLIASQDQRILDTVNEKFLSLNDQKLELKAKFLCPEDFKRGTVLQADGLFNPSKLPKTFSVTL